MLFDKECSKCGKIFQVERKWNGKEYYQIKKEKKFCSRKCANSHVQTKEMNEARRQKLKFLPDKFCKICGVKISRYSTYCMKHASELRRNKITYYIDENGCYICNSHPTNIDGTARIGVDGIKTTVYRYLWIQKYGGIPKGLELRHKCDNRRCINLEHLELGTHKENMQDMVNRNRHLKGENANSSKLTEKQVINILNDTEHSREELSEIYNISEEQIRRIKNRTSWSYLQI